MSSIQLYGHTNFIFGFTKIWIIIWGIGGYGICSDFWSTQSLPTCFNFNLGKYAQLDQYQWRPMLKLLKYKKHDKSGRSPGLSCKFWEPESTHFAWNIYTAVYSSFCTLYTCSAPERLFVLCSWSITCARLASVEVSLTILKTDRQTHTQTYRGSFRVRPGLKIISRIQVSNWPSHYIAQCY